MLGRKKNKGEQEKLQVEAYSRSNRKGLASHLYFFYHICGVVLCCVLGGGGIYGKLILGLWWIKEI